MICTGCIYKLSITCIYMCEYTTQSAHIVCTWKLYGDGISTHSKVLFPLLHCTTFVSIPPIITDHAGIQSSNSAIYRRKPSSLQIPQEKRLINDITALNGVVTAKRDSMWGRSWRVGHYIPQRAEYFITQFLEKDFLSNFTRGRNHACIDDLQSQQLEFLTFHTSEKTLHRLQWPVVILATVPVNKHEDFSSLLTVNRPVKY